MVITERQIAPFIQTWQNTLPQQFNEELASLILETNRIPDPYIFTEDKDGDLFSATARKKIKDSIYRGNYLGQVEGEVLDNINAWFRGNSEGVSLWLSPIFEGVYPDLKIIISQIEQRGREKVLVNRAIIFDYDRQQSLDLAQRLSSFSKDHPLLSSIEEIRHTPLILNSHDWISVFEQVIPDDNLWKSIREGEDLAAKDEALSQARLLYRDVFSTNFKQADTARQKIIAVLGNMSSSCPELLTGFQTFLRSSRVLGVVGSESNNGEKANRDKKDPDYCVHCGACGEVIDLVVRGGQECPGPKVGDRNVKEKSCGATRKC